MLIRLTPHEARSSMDEIPERPTTLTGNFTAETISLIIVVSCSPVTNKPSALAGIHKPFFHGQLICKQAL